MNRNNSFDLLRIIAMIMIMSLHFFGWGGAISSLSVKDYNYYWVMPVYLISGIGNTLFFMLAGYFLSGKVKYEKVLFLECKTRFYSIAVFILFLFIDLISADSQDTKVSLLSVVKSIFPIASNRYWFISVYLVLYLVINTLHFRLGSLGKKPLLIIVFALLFNNIFLVEYQYTLFEGLLGAVIGIYLKEYKEIKVEKRNRYILWYLGLLLIYVLERLFVQIFDIDSNVLDKGYRYICVLGMSALIIAIFNTLHIKKTFHVSNLLSVYIITANPLLVPFIYHNDIISAYKNWYYIFIYIGMNAILLIICTMIDKIVDRLNHYEARKILNFLENMELMK